MNVEGKWKLIEMDESGNLIEETQWNKNQIQDSWAEIACRLFAGSLSGTGSPTNGFLYLAIGEGDASWDLSPPNKSRTATQLQSEIDRILINQETDIAYLDPDDETPSVIPTRMIELTTLVDYNRAVGSLREFGIVCGDATHLANSGKLFNWISHSVRVKTVLSQLQLKVRIKFKVHGE